VGFLILNSGWGIEWSGGSFILYKELFNRGFEVPMHFKYEDNDYRLRMIILFDHGLFARKKKPYKTASTKPKRHLNKYLANLTVTNSKAMMPSTRPVRRS
jgi:hypothetical protein